MKDKISKKELLQGRIKDGLYQVNPDTNCEVNITHVSNKKESVLDWHVKLGYPSEKILHQALKSCKFKISGNQKLEFCSACQYGKSHKLPFKNSDSKASKPLELIHTDLWGPAPIPSKQGFRYYINFLDDFSRFSWVYPLKYKSEALAIFKQFKIMAEKQFDLPIKIIHSDSGGEFISFDPYLREQGIIHQLTCPHTYEQNGRVERKHRQIVESGLAMLASAKMPLIFWWEAFQTATYCINRLPSSPLKHKSPFETLFKKKPYYNSFHPFGCSVFPCLTPFNTQKLQFHSQKCLFLGYSDKHKGFKCFSPSSKLYVSRHVIFNHNEFPYQSLFENNSL